jgi:hypothetical protein
MLGGEPFAVWTNAVAVAVQVSAALGYEEVTAASVLAAELPVMSAPPPTIVPLEQVAVEVTVAPTAAFPGKAPAVPVTIVTVVVPLAPLQTYEVPLTETSFCPALAQFAPAASAVTVTL